MLAISPFPTGASYHFISTKCRSTLQVDYAVDLFDDAFPALARTM